ncbi:ribonuclease D [Natronospira proteinivora]|uniref:Ribonuclease D n=1 Tax=Natronospira proteinivora TaxID=1807133 RepID=A0ABT1G7T1_9GAMM|nr:ribonuclease D [Natronospira proteinivora]MCP1726037.1 ribonuclease D [Natronospira proteinivora]
MAETEFINQAEALKDFVERIRGADWLAVDTEFIREETYWPELCLIQIAAGDHLACIDPLALKGEAMAPLKALMLDPKVLKVFHAARQDLEVFHHEWGALPQPVFDTQVAASMLGHGDQVGYANLVQSLCGVELAKGHTRTDWRARPLPEAAVEYAADDVRYLGPVYQQLQQALKDSGRLTWLDEEFEQLTREALYLPDPANAWKRVKGHRKLRPRQLAVLVALAEWREEEALARNRPRRWIVKDQALVDLARRPPVQVEDMADMRDLPNAVREKHGRVLVERAQSGIKAEPPAVSSRPDRLSAEEDATVDALMALLRARCAEHDMSPAQVATRKQLEALIQGERDLPFLKGWRGAMAGQSLLDLLEGRLSLTVHEGKLKTA